MKYEKPFALAQAGRDAWMCPYMNVRAIGRGMRAEEDVEDGTEKEKRRFGDASKHR